MARRYVIWTKEKEDHLREWYNDRIKVSPYQIALRLRMHPSQIINKLAEWGRRKRIGNQDV